MIVGCNPLSLLVGRLFQERGEAVGLLDTDRDACRTAELENLQTIASSALDTDALEQAGLDTAGTFIAMTNNGEVNQVLAQRAAEEFKPPRVLAVVPGELAADRSDLPPAAPTGSKVQPAFVCQLPLKTWNRYLGDRDIKLGETVLQANGLADQQAHLRKLITSEQLMPLLLDRSGRLQVVAATEDWQEGDRRLYLWHDPTPKLIKRLGGGNSQTRLTVEKIPEVDEIPAPIPQPVLAESLPNGDIKE